MASRKAIVLGATLPSSRTRLQFILNQCKRNVRCSSEVSRRFKSSVSPSYQEDDDDNTYDTSSYPVQLPPKLLALVKTAKTTPTVTAARQKRESTVQPGPLLSQQEIDEKFFVSPSELVYPGNATIPITSHLHIVKPGEDVPRGKWPIFRLMVRESRIVVFFAHIESRGTGPLLKGPGLDDGHLTVTYAHLLIVHCGLDGFHNHENNNYRTRMVLFVMVTMTDTRTFLPSLRS